MNYRRHDSATGIGPRCQIPRGGARWVVIAAVRPWVLPMFELRGAVCDNAEQDWSGGCEPTERVREARLAGSSGRDFEADL
jgi:hypothetical protein